LVLYGFGVLANEYLRFGLTESPGIGRLTLVLHPALKGNFNDEFQTLAVDSIERSGDGGGRMLLESRTAPTAERGDDFAIQTDDRRLRR
jgi:hypothetical protein